MRPVPTRPGAALSPHTSNRVSLRLGHFTRVFSFNTNKNKAYYDPFIEVALLDIISTSKTANPINHQAVSSKLGDCSKRCLVMMLLVRSNQLIKLRK